MIAGVRQPRKLADLAGKQIKGTPKQLYDALHGRLTDHHRFLLKLHLHHGLDETVRKIDQEIDQRIVLCPGQNESARKRKSSRLRKGAP